MKLKIFDIPEEGLDIKAQSGTDTWFSDLVQDAFQQDYLKANPAALNIHLLKTCDNISLTGSAKIHLTPVCGRCLERFENHLEIPLHVDLAPYQKTDGKEGGEAELDAEDLNFAFYKGEEIDLSDIVREMLVLEIPLRYLCNESCRGLCPRCGQNLNTKTCGCVQPQEGSQFAVLSSWRHQKK